MVTRVEEIENHFLEKINLNELKPGDRLPTVREIKTIFNVGHVTAANALKGLSDKGRVKTIRGSGAFVCEMPRPELSKTSSGTIIFACGLDISQESGSLYMRAYQGAKEKAEKFGYALDFVSVDLAACETFDLDLANNAAAIISDSEEIIYQCMSDGLKAKGVELVYCGMGADLYDTNSVEANNFAGAFQATEHLIKCGHRKIGYVNVLDSSFSVNCHSFRVHGWRDSMKIAGLETPELMTWHVYKQSEIIIDLLKKIKKGHKNVPTALLIANDIMAAEIKQAAMMLGVNVPQDLSLIAFENHSRITDPDITTMECSGADFGREAISLIERIREYPACQPIHIQMPMRLMERGSVRKING